MCNLKLLIPSISSVLCPFSFCVIIFSFFFHSAFFWHGSMNQTILLKGLGGGSKGWEDHEIQHPWPGLISPASRCQMLPPALSPTSLAQHVSGPPSQTEGPSMGRRGLSPIGAGLRSWDPLDRDVLLNEFSVQSYGSWL